jgi:hypothetical protein
VRACKNARLRLSRLPFSPTQYEVVLGSDSNSRSKIVRHNGDDAVVVAEADTTNILDCFESKRFYVSWSANKIRVSLGSGSGQTVLEWLEDQRQIVAFAISLSSGPESDGDWKFSYDEGECQTDQFKAYKNFTFQFFCVHSLSSMFHKTGAFFCECC